MSSAEDEDYMIKLDANVELETIVRNEFEEMDDPTDLSLTFVCAQRISDLSDKTDNRSGDGEKESNIRYFDTVNVSPSSTKTEDASSSSTDQSSNRSPTQKSEVCSPSDEMEDRTPSAKEDTEEDRTSSKDDDNYPPFGKGVNFKELIVFCVDMSSDMEKVPFSVFDENSPWILDKWEAISKSIKPHGVEHTPLSMVKRVIEMFVHNKHFIDSKHRFALMVIVEKATWVCDFTNDPKEFMKALDDMNHTVECDTCDLGSIASLLLDKFPFVITREFGLPNFQAILRVILIYGRANCIPELLELKARDFFTNYPHIFLDILYLHEPPSEKNKISEVLSHIYALDTRGKSYIFEVGRSTTKLHNCMGKLLSHPFQRVPQDAADYKLANIMPLEFQSN